MTTYIYALKDPNTDEVRYVGQSTSPSTRVSFHYSKTSGGLYKQRWLEGLRVNGQRPTLEVLEYVEACDATERETWWIAEMQRRGHDLTNVRQAGENGRRRRMPEAEEKRRRTLERRATY